MLNLGVFDYATATVAGDPGDGAVASDEPVTTLSISVHDRFGNDVTAKLDAIEVGNGVFAQARTDATSWVLYRVTALPTAYTGTWYAVPVEVVESQGAAPDRNDDVVLNVFEEATEAVTVPGWGMRSDLTGPNGRPPTGADLAKWLTITATDADTLALLDGCCTAAVGYELGRLSTQRMTNAGYNPPEVLPATVAQAMLMRAAAIYRRRNSVNGFEGFADLGAVAIRASDPDIERLIDPWRAWAMA